MFNGIVDHPDEEGGVAGAAGDGEDEGSVQFHHNLIFRWCCTPLDNMGISGCFTALLVDGDGNATSPEASPLYSHTGWISVTDMIK
jgi:hypothetical protein